MSLRRRLIDLLNPPIGRWIKPLYAPPSSFRARMVNLIKQDIDSSQSALPSLIDITPDILWRAQKNGSMECFNQRFHEYTGVSTSEAYGSGWQYALHPEDRSRTVQQWNLIVAAGVPGEMELRMRRHDDEFRCFLFRAVPKHDNERLVINWYGSFTDIEDRKRVENKLRDDERELRGIVDTIPHLIHVFDAGGTFLYANRQVQDFTGLSLADIRAPDWRNRVFHRDDLESSRVEWTRAFSCGTPFEYELRALRHDGHYRWFLIHYSPLKDDLGRIIRWYATAMDIDDRKRREERIQHENIALREDIIRTSMCEEIIGSSVALRKTLDKLERVAPSDSTVLITGETGTGKELIARTIHRLSKRSTRAFIRVNCAAIPPALIASELFGHEKGAFTGAVQRRVGRFEAADGGTIFLDEIGDLPAETQIALLRVLQEHEFERIGSSQPLRVNVRVIAATHRDLKAEVAAGTFRQDLYYRLEVFPIHSPALRERLDDIPVLLEYLIARYAKKAGKLIGSVPMRTVQTFQAYGWPGNIRELQNVVERAVLLSDSSVFEVEESWLSSGVASPAATNTLAATLEVRERGMIEVALTECNGRIAGRLGAAAKLNMPRQTLDSRIAALHIDKRRFRAD